MFSKADLINSKAISFKMLKKETNHISEFQFSLVFPQFYLTLIFVVL